jgi:hypothetical protein
VQLLNLHQSTCVVHDREGRAFSHDRRRGTLADYQWTPPGKPRPNQHYRFCKTCGVRVFAQGDQKAMGGVFYAVAVASLDDADPDELASSIK